MYTLELASRLADEQGMQSLSKLVCAFKFHTPYAEMSAHSCWAGNGKMTWLIDFEGYALKNAPSLKARLTAQPSAGLDACLLVPTLCS